MTPTPPDGARFWLAVVITSFACTYGAANGSASDEGGAISDAVAQPDPWLDGELPPEVMKGTPRRGGTLVVRLQSQPPSLDQITDADLGTTWMLSRKVYESLGELDASKAPNYPLKPTLAESWTISPDGQTFTFKIRHGIRWQDGAPFSGQDVVATIRKILDPKVRAARWRAQYESLDDIQTPPGDDFTVIAHYKQPYFMALRSLATQPIYPKHILDAAGDMLTASIHRAPVGTGPFKFVSWDTGSQKITYARNEDYWGAKAWLDSVVYWVVKDNAVAYQMLLQGDFDIYTNLMPEMWTQAMPASQFLRAHYNRSRFFDANYVFIGWNALRPFFSDARVRHALTYLLDREGMRQQFVMGTYRATTCHFYSESSLCDHSLLPPPYDPEKAVALLNEAGWIDHDGDGIRDKDGVPFRFTFLISSSSTLAGKVAAYMQSAYRKVGIAVELKRVDYSIYSQALREHLFDACTMGWGYTDVVTDPRTIWHSSQVKGGSNYVNYNSPLADSIIEAASKELDDDKRAALFRELGRVLYDDAPYTWLYTRPALDAISKRVHGIQAAVPWYDLQAVWVEQG